MVVAAGWKASEVGNLRYSVAVRSTHVQLSRRAFGLGGIGLGGLALAGCGSEAATPIPTASIPSLIATSTEGSVGASVSASASASRAPAVEITSLDSITVTGAFGSDPKIDAPYPLKVAKTMSKVVVTGDGPEVTEGGYAYCNYVGINAATGEQFGTSFASSGNTPTSFQLSTDSLINGFVTGLKGKHIGDRVLIVITSADGYDGSDKTSIGIEQGDSLLFVVDIIFASLSKPWGTAVTPSVAPSGLGALSSLPTVTDHGEDVAPTVTIPSGATKPTSVVVQTLIQGKGPTIAAADAIHCKYVSVNWDSGKVIAEDFTTGAESGTLSSLIAAWQTGLVGKTGGSRVMIIAPPDKAYPDGNATPSIPAGVTQVYVVDVLYAAPAA
jgi:peptidylprolyl isomerase